MIQVNRVEKSYGGFMALQDVNWTVQEGEWWGIIGPNGSGKSTLLQMLSGVEIATSGNITIKGKDIKSYSRKVLSQMMAVLEQDGLPAMDYPVRDVLEMGRFPFQDWLGRDQGDNVDILVEGIMAKLELLELSDRSVAELSGGQRQRVALGKVMAQEPQILLLDEPTTYLDIHYQLQFMELVADWRASSGITVIAVLHDLNLAAQFCDKLLVLEDGQVAGMGTPQDILTASNIRDVYEVDPVIVTHPDIEVPQVLLTRRKLK
ncbi:ABC transporter ATP-binding protein [Paenibacillus sp. IHBB 10380]|uniref:ABC transporter ATP-binding protein n=1 Tax=Paenibacillus sp. IHBB 10380 TaxID=1566358 RepID=UPI0005CFC740|nr:ABC transporter ATP-binding protein [Paenibacillus sp. IHBB 10380]AJS61585.1 ABC transporter ATP-binding protein [Paenibacillus sp. IHBB 10380]